MNGRESCAGQCCTCNAPAGYCACEPCPDCREALRVAKEHTDRLFARMMARAVESVSDDEDIRF